MREKKNKKYTPGTRSFCAYCHAKSGKAKNVFTTNGTMRGEVEDGRREMQSSCSAHRMRNCQCNEKEREIENRKKKKKKNNNNNNNNNDRADEGMEDQPRENGKKEEELTTKIKTKKDRHGQYAHIMEMNR